MAFITVTNTFVNGATADATAVNQNFTDLINGTSDGTKSFNIAALTTASTVTLNGAVTLGQSTSNALTVLAALSSSIPVATNTSYDVGTATLGLKSVYIGGSSTFTVRLLGPTLGSSWTFTLPVSAGSVGNLLHTDGTGLTTWINTNSADSRRNYSLTTSVGSNLLTVTLNAADGTAPSSTNPVYITFRNATAATGTAVTRAVTGSISINTSGAGATLGLVSAQNEYIYVYALDNAGTVELILSGSKNWDEGTVQSTTAMSAGSTSRITLYSTTARSNVAIRLIGRLKSNQVTSGTYLANATEVSLTGPFQRGQSKSEIYLKDGNGYGSTNTKVRRYSTIVRNVGSDFTYADSATLGALITINTEGMYAVHIRGDDACAAILNCTFPTVSSQGLSAAQAQQIICYPALVTGSCSAVMRFYPGDTITPLGTGAGASGDYTVGLLVSKVSD